MITTERTIGVTFRIFTKNHEQMQDVIEKIRQDFISVGRHYEKENTDEIQVHPIAQQKCARCNKSFPECKCGAPNRSPAV